MRMLREFGEEPDFELAELTQTAARARVSLAPVLHRPVR